MDSTVGPRRLDARTPDPKRRVVAPLPPAAVEEDISYIIDLLHSPQKRLAIDTFGTDAVKKWEGAGYKVRQIWELSSPTTQCTNIIGGVDATTPCWLCGLKIQETPTIKANCEHVLPIAQAVMVLDLYKAKVERGNESPFFKLEYAWAHSICNQIKDDDVYFKDTSPLEVDEVAIGRLLTNIRKSTREGIEQLLPKFGPDWEKTRTPIIAKKYQEIINFMKGPIAQSGALYYLAMAAGASDLSGHTSQDRQLLVGELAVKVREIRDIEKLKFEQFSKKLIRVPEQLARVVLDKLIVPKYETNYFNFYNRFFNVKSVAELKDPIKLKEQVASIVVDNFYPIYEKVYANYPSKADPAIIQLIIAKIFINMKRDLTEYEKENRIPDEGLMKEIDVMIESSLSTIPPEFRPEVEDAVMKGGKHRRKTYRRRRLPKLV